MAITRKIEEVIGLGGSVRSDKPIKRFKAICQKVRLDILEQVDEAVAERAGMNRSSWIQEAIQEKLKRLKDVHNN